MYKHVSRLHSISRLRLSLSLNENAMNSMIVSIECTTRSNAFMIITQSYMILVTLSQDYGSFVALSKYRIFLLYVQS